MIVLLLETGDMTWREHILLETGDMRLKETYYMSKRDLLHEIVLLLETKTNIATLSTATQSKN